MESEVGLNRGRGADLKMVASRTKKGNGTMELVGFKVKLNEERKPERNKTRGADRTDLRFKSQDTMMAATWIAMVAFIEFLKALALNCGTRNECERPKEE